MSAAIRTELLIEQLQERLNYHFHDKNLILLALTHSSYANEVRIGQCHNNERLEFLGDAVLELVSSDFLYHSHEEMEEGGLSKLRASLVCELTLSLCAKKLDLGETLFLGKGEEATGGRERDSILSDALEAVIGAIYLDGGIDEARKFILGHVLDDIECSNLFYDSKSRLQELVQNVYHKEVTYHLLSEKGPDHNKVFTMQAMVDETVLAEGTGKTKKAATQDAAFHALHTLIMK